ncbi:MAG: GDP-L-fucose synthase [Bacteroidales bacterium]|nr:GDP-L-fucose synthase [Bacteroidales bacterium]
MEKNAKIYVAGHTGLVGSAITKTLKEKGYTHLLTRDFSELDLSNQAEVQAFFKKEKPEYVILAAAKVGGVVANNTYRGEFIYQNLMIQNNVIHQAWLNGTKKLLFLGSTCIYPREAPQPMKEEYLLSGPLEYTNEPYAIAKIAGMKLCESYNIQYGTNFIAVMPTNLYGPNDNFDLEKSHVLPALLRKIHLGKCLENKDWEAIRKDLNTYPIEGIDGSRQEHEILNILDKYGIRKKNKQVNVEIWGSGTPLREFMYSEDMAAACVFMMEKVNIGQINAFTPTPTDPKDPRKIHFVNIGTGQEISIKDLAEKIKNTLNFRGELCFNSEKPDGTKRKLTNVDLLHGLGFKHSIELTQGLDFMYQAYLEKQA